MTRAAIHLALLLAQAQKVGRSLETALSFLTKHGKFHPDTKKKWRLHYDAQRKQDQMRAEFLASFAKEDGCTTSEGQPSSSPPRLTTP